MPKQETPAELAEWMEERAELLVKAAHRVKSNAEAQEDQPAGEWLLTLLRDLSSISTISTRSVHLLTAYALRTGAASQTDVAKATDVTTTAAGNRSGSKLARETWQEVWPEKR